jgi:hypothetical protein
MNPLFNSLLLTICSLVLTGCAVTAEYGSQAEAEDVAEDRSRELAQIQTLGSDYKKLWDDKSEFEKWKKSAIPVFRELGVTSADLHHRGSVISSVTGSIEDEGSEIQYLQKKIYYGVDPKLKPGDISAGLYQIPGRFELAKHGQGGSIRSSRGKCTVRGVPTTIYAYDFFGHDRDYFLRCEFWVPETQ